MKPLNQHNSRVILNCSFHSVTEEDVLQWAKDLLDSSQRGYLTTVNVAMLMMMRTDKKLRNFIESSAMTVADGQPVIWLSKLLGRPLPQRVAGVDLCYSLARLAAQNNKSLYLLGATDAIIEHVQRRLKRNNPDLIITGKSNGYFSDCQTPNMVQRIKDSGADILYVGMGVPRQEGFIQDNWEQLGVKLAIPVGGSFDVIAGCKRRAPKWMQSFGLEWCFRLLQEPRRLAKRYAVTNTKFIWLSVKALLRR
ncbi:MAG: WecB/TagA/CpsF family glycosyltransferase [Robiginitomaculum sp.]|nr:WecB/TagA/CpsF family glycosyltransferase [Robiginitomaculum sp.]